MKLLYWQGQGHNGADGVAIARHLTTIGYRVRIFLLFLENEGIPELNNQLKLAKSFGAVIHFIENSEQIKEYLREKVSKEKSRPVIIDAIFGTGVTFPLANFYYDIIWLVNQYKFLTVAIDLPSGVSGDTGLTQGKFILADHTLVVGLPKVGCYIGKGLEAVGKIHVLEAGFPREVLENGNKFVLSFFSYYGLCL